MVEAHTKTAANLQAAIHSPESFRNCSSFPFEIVAKSDDTVRTGERRISTVSFRAAEWNTILYRERRTNLRSKM